MLRLSKVGRLNDMNSCYDELAYLVATLMALMVTKFELSDKSSLTTSASGQTSRKVWVAATRCHGSGRLLQLLGLLGCTSRRTDLRMKAPLGLHQILIACPDCRTQQISRVRSFMKRHTCLITRRFKPLNSDNTTIYKGAKPKPKSFAGSPSTFATPLAPTRFLTMLTEPKTALRVAKKAGRMKGVIVCVTMVSMRTLNSTTKTTFHSRS